MDEKYLCLFNAISDTITELDKIKHSLILIQQHTEELYISDGDSAVKEDA